MSFDVEKWMADNYGLLGVYDIANTIRAAAGACENVRDQEMRDLAEFKNREIVKLIAERDEARAQLAIASRDKEQGAVQHVKGAWNDRCMCDPCVLVRDIVNAQVAAAFSVAADYIDECNINGPYQAIGAAPALRALTPADAARELERKVLEAYYRGREMGHASKCRAMANIHPKPTDELRKTLVGNPSVEEWAEWIVSRHNFCERNAGESLREISLVALRNVESR